MAVDSRGRSGDWVLIQLFGIDLASVLLGAAASALTLGFRTIMVAPVKAATDHSRYIRWASLVFPQKPFDGSWRVAWHVESDRFPEVNLDEVKIYSVLKNVTFTTDTRLKDGSQEKCVFVGKLSGLDLTGRWYVPRDEGRGYFGVFQVRLHGTLRDGHGSWSGWTSDGKVQSNVMSIERI